MLVSHPGAWQRAIQKHIESYPFVHIVAVAGGSLSAAQLAKESAPDLIVIDSSIPIDDVIALVQNVKQEIPGTRSIVIADTTQQRRRIIRYGADYTIPAFNYEAQIGYILKQLDSNQTGRTGSVETTVTTDPQTPN